MFNNSYELLNCPISLCCHKSLILAVDHLKRLKSNVILCDTLSCGSMMSVYCGGLVQDRERYIFFNTTSNSTKTPVISLFKRIYVLYTLNVTYFTHLLPS